MLHVLTTLWHVYLQLGLYVLCDAQGHNSTVKALHGQSHPANIHMVIYQEYTG